jgi:adenylate kinase family enzyme
MRVLVTGASGSGTSTLARTVAARIQAAFYDGDDYFWLPTSPPFKDKRDPQQRLDRLLHDLDAAPVALLSGSIVGWGAELEDSFSLIVFLTVPASTRIERLRRREIAQLGHADPEFLEWAAQYDEGRLPGRNRAKHERWLSARRCPVLRIEGEIALETSTARVLAAIARLANS